MLCAMQQHVAWFLSLLWPALVLSKQLAADSKTLSSQLLSAKSCCRQLAEIVMPISSLLAFEAPLPAALCATPYLPWF
jgi:hypothetical protein